MGESGGPVLKGGVRVGVRGQAHDSCILIRSDCSHAPREQIQHNSNYIHSLVLLKSQEDLKVGNSLIRSFVVWTH